MATYDVRLTCETETGDGKGFHYARWSAQPDAVAKTSCPDHPSAVVRDFVVERENQ